MSRRPLLLLTAIASVALAASTAIAADKVVRRAEIRMELRLRSEACQEPLAAEIAREPGVTTARWDGKAISVVYDPEHFGKDRLMEVIRTFAARCPPAGE